jgi:hypothetical protein
VLLLRWLGSWLTRCGTHCERSRWDVGQLESDAVCDAFSGWGWLATGTADCCNQEQNGGELKEAAHWTDGQKKEKRTIGGRCGSRQSNSSWTRKSIKF